MKRVVFICPYFGKLPKEQTQLWLKTCLRNPGIDWIIVTDDKTKFAYPSNVKVIYTSLEALKKEIQKKFDFEISLEHSYKMCDYKPVFGYIFSDYIGGYDYWGHFDFTDAVLGDVKKLLGDVLECEHDKIGFLGHLSLYKNNEEVNTRFMLPTKTRRQLSEIFGNPDNQAFDETFEYGIDRVYADNGFEIKRIDDLYVDVSTKKWPFRRALWSENFDWVRLLEEKYIFEWNNGSLYKISLKANRIIKEEILYAHYQKRKVKYEIDMNNTEHFYIVPNAFIDYRPLSIKDIRKYTKDKIINPISLKTKIKKIKKKIGKNK